MISAMITATLPTGSALDVTRRGRVGAGKALGISAGFCGPLAGTVSRGASGIGRAALVPAVATHKPSPDPSSIRSATKTASASRIAEDEKPVPPESSTGNATGATAGVAKPPGGHAGPACKSVYNWRRRLDAVSETNYLVETPIGEPHVHRVFGCSRST